MRIRLKILTGFLILMITLAVAGVWSIHELNTMGTSVQRILDDNYTSLHAAKMMIEALERQNQGTLLLVSGNWDAGRAIMTSADSLFELEFDMAQAKEANREKIQKLDMIRSSYDSYKEIWEKPIVGTKKEGNLDWYLKELHVAFLNAKSSVNGLVEMNDKVMYDTATDIRNRSYKAIMPGVIAVTAAFVFSLIFNFFMNHYLIGPLVKIRDGVKMFVEREVPFDVEVDTDDEISDLASMIGTLCIMVQKSGREE